MLYNFRRHLFGLGDGRRLLLEEGKIFILVFSRLFLSVNLGSKLEAEDSSQ